MKNKQDRIIKQKGVTLLEMMIVIVIMGILAAIAIPSYRKYVRETHRATAQARMLETEGLLRAHYLQNGRYTQAFVDNINAEPELRFSPNSGDQRYDIQIVILDPVVDRGSEQTFRIEATPLNGQVGDNCEKLTYNSMGVKEAVKLAGSQKISGCWK